MTIFIDRITLIVNSLFDWLKDLTTFITTDILLIAFMSLVLLRFIVNFLKKVKNRLIA